MRIPAPLSLLMLAMMTLVGGTYLAVAVLGIDPRVHYATVTVELRSSGGLMDTSPVTLRGVRIGRVTAITATPDGLMATVRIDTAYRIPADSGAEIANLSAVGEQYLDFRPTGDAGPYLRDGMVVPAAHVHTPPTVADALARVKALLAQLDPDTITRLLDTLATGYRGRDGDLATINRATELLGQTLVDKQGALRRLYLNAQTLTGNFDGYGPTLGAIAPDISAATPDLVQVNEGFEQFSKIGDGIWADPYGVMNTKTDQYLRLLAPDLATLAATLRPVLAPLRPLRIDAGSLMDLLDTVFPGGAARITIDIPHK